MMRAKITKSLVDNISPRSTDLIVWDTDLKGFGLKVTPTGTKLYFLYYRTSGGRQRKPRIGRHGDLTTEQARKIAKTWAAEAVLGGDVSGQRQAERKASRVTELAEQYLTDYAELHKKPSSVVSDRAIIDNHILPLIGSMKIADVARSDIEHVKLSIRNGKTAAKRNAKPRGRRLIRGGPVVANRAIALLSKMFGCAVDWGLRETNPASSIKKFRENRKDRFLDASEVGRLLTALDNAESEETESPYAIAAIRVLLFTGLRRGEVAGLRWADVDLDRASLRLDDTKTGGRTVPLNSEAVQILKNLPRAYRGDTVFQSLQKDGQIALTRPWYRIRKAAGIDSSATLHTLRHTFASWSVMGGLSLAQVGALLGHKSAQTTLRYADHIQDAVRQYSEQTASTITNLRKPLKS
ncbi:MAG: tyrosine-type recombinase/integrase [Rhodospirillaceae bacterium]|jgi:integrase|nr:tyrosine-type recombinase/integrase [Rhodospirillaceae bacterium]